MRKRGQKRVIHRALLGDLLRNFLGLLVIIVALTITLQRIADLSTLFPLTAITVFVCGSALMLLLATKHLRTASFGPANQVTFVRGSLVALLFGLVADPAAAWIGVVVASAALALDGLDGWLARRLQVASEFGARFDMETDALLLVALTLLAWAYDKAGPWILVAGLMRYLFVASSALLPFLAGSLPPSRRRQSVFVVQGIALIVCISPIVGPPVSGAVALMGLGLLTWSFAIDVVYLARHGGDVASHSV